MKDENILRAALLGYESQLQGINTQIAEVKRRLGQTDGDAAGAATGTHTPRKKHRISAEGRARIAAAQRKRWANAKRG